MKARTTFLSADNNFTPPDPWAEIIANFGPIGAAEAVDMARQLEEQASDLYDYALEKNPKLKRPVPPKNIPKNYFLLCMARSEQEDARKLAKTTGSDLRTVIRWAIQQMMRELKEEANIRHLTGIDIPDQRHFFGFKCRDN